MNWFRARQICLRAFRQCSLLSISLVSPTLLPGELPVNADLGQPPRPCACGCARPVLNRPRLTDYQRTAAPAVSCCFGARTKPRRTSSLACSVRSTISAVWLKLMWLRFRFMGSLKKPRSTIFSR